METIPIVRPGRTPSHIAVRYSAAEGPRGAAAAADAAGHCFLYLHGFGSEQSARASSITLRTP